MTLHWYKRYPEAALSGMKCLSLEERGAYDTVLDLIYLHDGELDDDDRFIAGWCSCDVRIWRRIKVRLLALDKLYLVDGKLRNVRSDREVAKALARGTSGRYAGQQSALARAAKSVDVLSNNNGLEPTHGPTNRQRTPQPFLEDKISRPLLEPLGRQAARAAAAPDGPPREPLPDIAKWADRLDQFKPWMPRGQRGRWEASWGPRPDSAGRNPLIPEKLLADWRANYAAEISKLRGAA